MTEDGARPDQARPLVLQSTKNATRKSQTSSTFAARNTIDSATESDQRRHTHSKSSWLYDRHGIEASFREEHAHCGFVLNTHQTSEVLVTENTLI